MIRIFRLRAKPRGGVTLLELILALGLSTVLLAIIGMALGMYWRMFDQRRTSLDEARIARSVLRKVGDDLRNTIQFQPPDLSGLNIVSASMQGQLGDAAGALGSLASGGAGNLTNLAAGAAGNQNQANSNQASQVNATNPASQNTAASGGSQGGNQAGGAQNQRQSQGAGGSARQPPSAAASGSASGATGQDPLADETGMGDTTQPATQLGLRGTMYELQIDISRLPRIDEYTSLTDPNNPLDVVDIPSDVKTISYFVVASEQEGAQLQVGLKAGEELAPIRGLYRRERSRALSSLGAPLTPDGIARDNSQLLASEVTAIEFSYFDGYEWFSDWDSESMGGLPRAIEIAIEVNMSQPDETSSLDTLSLDNALDANTTEAEPAVYKLVVAVPADPVFQLPIDSAAQGDMSGEMGMDPTGMNGQDTSGLQAAGLQAQAGMGLGGAGLGGAGISGAGIGGAGQGGGPGGRGGRGQGRGGGQNGQNAQGRGGQNGGDQNGQGNQGQGGRGRGMGRGGQARGGGPGLGQGSGGRGGQGGQGLGGRGGAGLGGMGGQGLGGRGGGGLGGAGLGGFGGGMGGSGMGGAGLGGGMGGRR
jgi:hypothetical protein